MVENVKEVYKTEELVRCIYLSMLYYRVYIPGGVKLRVSCRVRCWSVAPGITLSRYGIDKADLLYSIQEFRLEICMYSKEMEIKPVYNKHNNDTVWKAISCFFLAVKTTLQCF